MSEIQPQQPDGFDDAPPLISDADIFGDGDAPDMTAEEQGQSLERLVQLANDLQAKDAEVVKANEALALVKGEADKLRSTTIPNLMQRLKMESFRLEDGSEINVKKDIKCSLSEERKPAGLAWIREQGHGGIIKTEVVLSFGKGEEAKAKEAEKLLREKGFTPDVGDSVHAQTLKSFVKERMEAGDNIPLATFGVFEFKEAKITLPKKKKKK
jgi:hypothetical protein